MNCGYSARYYAGATSDHFYYYLDEFPTRDASSRISSIGIMEFNDPKRCDGQDYRFDVIIFKPKEEYMHRSVDQDGCTECYFLTGSNEEFPRLLHSPKRETPNDQSGGDIQYLQEQRFGYHHIQVNDRVNRSYWGKFDDTFIDDIFKILGKHQVLCGEDLTGRLRSQVLGLTNLPRACRIAQMRFEATQLLEKPTLQNHLKIPLIKKITMTALATPLDSLTLAELKELTGEDASDEMRHFQQKFVDVIKFTARFKLYRGCPRDFANPNEANKYNNSIFSLVRQGLLQRQPLIPHDAINLISSHLTTADMPPKPSAAMQNR